MSERDQRPWWYRWIIQPIKNQLTQGTTPEKLGWTIGAAIALGIFPILGSTTALCFFAAYLFRLNQPVMYVFKTLIYPLHLSLILVFIRYGQKMHGAELIRFSVPQLLERFLNDPMQFAKDFGLAAWHGITAWMLVAPFLVLAGRLIATPILQTAQNQWKARLS